MIVKRTFISSGSQKQDVAATMNAQIRDYLVGTGVFRLVSAEIGDADRPKYTLEYKDSGYQLILQSHLWDYKDEIVIGVKRGALDTVARWNNVCYGRASEATITIHLITSGDSFAFKVFNAENQVHFGGSCIRYTTFDGEQGYLYHSNEWTSQMGYMGRYENEEKKVCQVSYSDYPRIQHAIIQEHPILILDGVAVGYANDLVTIHVNGLSESHTFSAYRFHDEEYYGGKIAHGPNAVSDRTAAALKGGNKYDR